MIVRLHNFLLIMPIARIVCLVLIIPLFATGAVKSKKIRRRKTITDTYELNF